MKILRPAVRAVVSLTVAVMAWYAVATAVQTLRDVDFPTPLDTAERLVALFAGERLSERSIYRHIRDSLLRLTIGFGIGAAAAVVTGVAAGSRETLRSIVAPLLHALQLVPSLAWIPVALLLFGVGEMSTVFMIVMAVLTPVAICVMDGVSRVDTQYIRAARMLGAEEKTVFLHVLLPASLPALITGLRLGLGHGWRVVVAAEMIVGTGTGLGYSIIEARWTLDYASAFACVAVICAIGLLFERFVFERIETVTIKRWTLTKDA
jgi:ABC-type nitrate/sulfonate/bicarbonate transport system permease component